MLADALPLEGLPVEPAAHWNSQAVLIVRRLAPALIMEPAAATYIHASREGFGPRQPA